MSKNSSKKSNILVRFTYPGQSNPLQICDSEEDLTTPVGEFLSQPSLSVNKIIYQGGTRDTPLKLRLREDQLGLASQLTEGTGFPIVTVKVWEYENSDNVSVTRPLFEGEIYIGRRNVDGRSGVFEFEARNEKERHNISSGIPIFEECDSTFESIYSCKFDATPLRVNRTLELQDGVIITLNEALPSEGRLWPRGYVEFNNYRILILDWNGSDQLRLGSRPPLTWIGQEILVSPGCDQLIGTCGEIYNNLSEIAAYGAAIPDYHPIFENPR